jgi:Na+/proline symporter
MAAHGFPGLAYWSGLLTPLDAIGLRWVHIQLAQDSKRQQDTASRSGAITIPDFFPNGSMTRAKFLMTIASQMIIVFFTPYAGKLLMALRQAVSHFSAHLPTWSLLRPVRSDLPRLSADFWLKALRFSAGFR